MSLSACNLSDGMVFNTRLNNHYFAIIINVKTGRKLLNGIPD